MWGFVASPTLGLARHQKVNVLSRPAWPSTAFGWRGVSNPAHTTCMSLRSNNLQPWEDLIDEFEARNLASLTTQSSPGAHLTDGDNESSTSSRSFPARPQGRPLGRENPEQYKLRNLVETSAMTAGTLVLWFLGRALQLDSFLILIYPFPSLFIWMRWGPRYGRMMFFTTTTLILSFMGPLYALTFSLNTGFLALALGTAMWYRWHWISAIIAGCAAKFLGLILNVTWTSAILRCNTWKLVGEQVKTMIDQVGALVFRFFRDGAAFQGPTLSQVQLGVAFLVVFHSLFHVLLTHMATTMVLDRLYDEGTLARSPPMVPWIAFLKTIANKQYGDLKADPFARRPPRRKRKS